MPRSRFSLLTLAAVLLAPVCGVRDAAAAPFAYIPNSGSGTVSVIDAATDSVVDTITVGTTPAGVAVSPDGRRVYVTNVGDDTVSVIRTVDDAVIATLPTGNLTAISNDSPGVTVLPDSSKFYVANTGDDTVSIYDAISNTLITTVAVGDEPRAIVPTVDGQYVAAYGSGNIYGGGSLTVIHAASNTVVAAVPFAGFPVGVVSNSTGTRIYVADPGSFNDLLQVYDITVFPPALLASVTTSGDAPVGVVLSPDDAFAYVTSSNLFALGSASVGVFSTVTNTLVDSIPLPGNPIGIDITPDGSKLYVAESVGGSVIVLSTATNSIIGTIPVGSAPIAYGRFMGPATPAPEATCGNGIVELGEQCDDDNLVNGDCCSDACAYEPASTVCRAAVGSCDVAEQCTGASATCPADTVLSSGTECRAVAGACDVAESCDGLVGTCPADDKVASGTVCRAGTDLCDAAESCDGVGVDCPADGLVPSGIVCRAAADPCDAVESCDGAQATCPSDEREPDGDADGLCDPQDACTNVAGGQTFLASGKPKLSLAKINTDVTPDNDSISLGATFDLPVGSSFATLNPSGEGARLVLRNDAGGIEVDAALPSGTYLGKGSRGWSTNGAGTVWKYTDSTANPVEGITSLQIKDKSKSSPRRVQVVVKGKKATYPVVASDSPVNAVVVLGNQAAAIAGECGESSFVATDCKFNGSGSTLLCKK